MIETIAAFADGLNISVLLRKLARFEATIQIDRRHCCPARTL
ncbi:MULTISPECIES: hypothetical protein [Bradyrhizobium]|nr:hypothetical protein [Bradyrhizobium elkanii]WLA87367.1 hypothetical protein QNJ99_03135 [Bradyrhizobium elkanii]